MSPPNKVQKTFFRMLFVGEATFEIFNVLGQRIYSRAVRIQDGKLEEEILLLLLVLAHFPFQTVQHITGEIHKQGLL